MVPSGHSRFARFRYCKFIYFFLIEYFKDTFLWKITAIFGEKTKQLNTLSILIPAYNWDCSQLISNLHAQGCAIGMPFEIIVADDHSTDSAALDAVCGTSEGLEHCRLIRLEQNVGRSAIRNMLADMAKYDKLLFMDCDAAVCSQTYLKDYIDASDRADVVCGGVRNLASIPCPEVILRWKYERSADRKRSAAYRSRKPYANFTPFNFLISRDTFSQIRFDTTFCGYGYEDVLFGMELERRQVTVLHIDNPLLHLGLESNERYLVKTDEAINNLLIHRNEIGNGSALLQHYDRICRWHSEPLLGVADKLLYNSVRRNLLGSHPALPLFALYKLMTVYRKLHRDDDNCCTTSNSAL